MAVKGRIARLAKGISEHCGKIDERSTRRFIDALERANRVFIAGAGRSGLVARAFAMRLMQLGFRVHVVGEVTTPGARADDLLIIISGSGETNSMSCVLQRGKDHGAKTVAITSNPESAIGKSAGMLVHVGGKSARDLARSGLKVPLGTPFELSTMLFLDAVIEELVHRHEKTAHEMHLRHANLE